MIYLLFLGDSPRGRFFIYEKLTKVVTNMNENNALRRARVQRIIDFAVDVQKLNANRGNISTSLVKKLERYSLSFTAMKEDEKLRPAAEAFLKVIELFGELRKAIIADNISRVIYIRKEIEHLMYSAEEVAKQWHSI